MSKNDMDKMYKIDKYNNNTVTLVFDRYDRSKSKFVLDDPKLDKKGETPFYGINKNDHKIYAWYGYGEGIQELKDDELKNVRAMIEAYEKLNQQKVEELSTNKEQPSNAGMALNIQKNNDGEAIFTPISENTSDDKKKNDNKKDEKSTEISLTDKSISQKIGEKQSNESFKNAKESFRALEIKDDYIPKNSQKIDLSNNISSLSDEFLNTQPPQDHHKKNNNSYESFESKQEYNINETIKEIKSEENSLSSSSADAKNQSSSSVTYEAESDHEGSKPTYPLTKAYEKKKEKDTSTNKDNYLNQENNRSNSLNSTENAEDYHDDNKIERKKFQHPESNTSSSNSNSINNYEGGGINENNNQPPVAKKKNLLSSFSHNAFKTKEWEEDNNKKKQNMPQAIEAQSEKERNLEVDNSLKKSNDLANEKKNFNDDGSFKSFKNFDNNNDIERFVDNMNANIAASQLQELRDIRDSLYYYKIQQRIKSSTEENKDIAIDKYRIIELEFDKLQESLAKIFPENEFKNDIKLMKLEYKRLEGLRLDEKESEELKKGLRLDEEESKELMKGLELNEDQYRQLNDNKFGGNEFEKLKPYKFLSKNLQDTIEAEITKIKKEQKEEQEKQQKEVQGQQVTTSGQRQEANTPEQEQQQKEKEDQGHGQGQGQEQKEERDQEQGQGHSQQHQQHHQKQQKNEDSFLFHLVVAGVLMASDPTGIATIAYLSYVFNKKTSGESKDKNTTHKTITKQKIQNIIEKKDIKKLEEELKKVVAEYPEIAKEAENFIDDFSKTAINFTKPRDTSKSVANPDLAPLELFDDAKMSEYDRIQQLLQNRLDKDHLINSPRKSTKSFSGAIIKNENTFNDAFLNNLKVSPESKKRVNYMRRCASFNNQNRGILTQNEQKQIFNKHINSSKFNQSQSQRK